MNRGQEGKDPFCCYLFFHCRDFTSLTVPLIHIIILDIGSEEESPQRKHRQHLKGTWTVEATPKKDNRGQRASHNYSQ